MLLELPQIPLIYTFSQKQWMQKLEVVTLLGSFLEDQKIMQDYRIAGNANGNTIIIRFANMGLDSLGYTCTTRYMLPKSPSTWRRDNDRLDSLLVGKSTQVTRG
jgi:hypothetical protein